MDAETQSPTKKPDGTVIYHCEDCEKHNQPPRELGPFSAQRSLDLYGRVICGECAQRIDPRYQEWLRDEAYGKMMEAV